jgi:hypothetical protein
MGKNEIKQVNLWVIAAAALVLTGPALGTANAIDSRLGAGFTPTLLADNGDQDRVMDRLRTDLGLSDGEVQRLREGVGLHLKNGGSEQTLRQMTQVALRNGCRDQCLENAVRSMNRDMQQGMSATASRKRVEKAIRSAAQNGDSQGMTERLKQRLEPRDRYKINDSQPMHNPTGGGMRGSGGGRR